MTDIEYKAEDVAQSIASRVWTQHDASAITEIFTPDVVYGDVAWDYEFTGQQAVLDYFHRVLLGIPDFAEEIDDIIDVRPGIIISHWHYSGTFRDENIEKPFRLPGTSVITMRGDKVARNIDYYGGDAFLAALDWTYATREALRDRETSVSMAAYAGGNL